MVLTGKNPMDPVPGGSGSEIIITKPVRSFCPVDRGTGAVDRFGPHESAGVIQPVQFVNGAEVGPSGQTHVCRYCACVFWKADG